MEIKKYNIENIKTNPEIIDKISKFIKDTFCEIDGFYSSQSNFKKEVNGKLSDTINNLNNENIFYIIQDSQKEISACLRGQTCNNVQIGDIGSGKMFFVKYIATDKNHRNQHLATQLIREFEAEAISEAVDTNRPISISSRVNKQNIASQNRHLANGYHKYNEGEDSEYFGFYKDFPVSK